MGTGLGKPVSLHLGRLLAGLTAAVLLVAVLRLTERSERLIELPRNATDAPVLVRAGRVFYQPLRRGPDFTLVGLPVQGGRPQRLIQDPALTSRVERIQVNSAGIFYTFGEPGDPSLNTGPGSSPMGVGASNTAQPTMPPVRVMGLTRWPQLSRKRGRMAPIEGGSPQELIPDEYASTLQIREQYCYWIRSRRTGDRLLTREVERPHGDLMVADLAGGPHRRLGRVPDDLLLQPCGAGICWRQDSDSYSALLTCGPPDFSIEAFPHFPPGSTPVWLGDRLFWLQDDATAPASVAPRFHLLMSARRDGSDRRLLWDADTRGNPSGSLNGLFDDGRDLFFIADRLASNKLTRAITRYRLAPMSKPEILLRTAGVANAFRTISVDGGYLYLINWEERENWLDWSRAGLMRRRVGVLRRIRLPD